MSGIEVNGAQDEIRTHASQGRAAARLAGRQRTTVSRLPPSPLGYLGTGRELLQSSFSSFPLEPLAFHPSVKDISSA